MQSSSQHFGAFLDEDARHESLKYFNITDPDARIYSFLYEKICKGYPQLWEVCEKIMVISHGQTTVERGFSVNKEVEVCIMHEDMVTAHILVCDYVTVCVRGNEGCHYQGAPELCSNCNDEIHGSSGRGE